MADSRIPSPRASNAALEALAVYGFTGTDRIIDGVNIREDPSLVSTAVRTTTAFLVRLPNGRTAEVTITHAGRVPSLPEPVVDAEVLEAGTPEFKAGDDVAYYDESEAAWLGQVILPLGEDLLVAVGQDPANRRVMAWRAESTRHVPVGPMSFVLTDERDSRKMLVETLSVAQTYVGGSPLGAEAARHVARLQRLVNAIEGEQS